MVAVFRNTALVLSMLVSVYALAFAAEDSVTPYGDYCAVCADYGVCRDVLSVSEAVSALRKYYGDRGYKVGTVHHKGRFIEADIFKEGSQVDKVLLDRKSGRLRSIY